MTTITSDTNVPSKRQRSTTAILGSLFNNQESVIATALLVLIVVILIVNPLFRNWQNAADILTNSAYIAVAAIGTTMVIISGNIDISMGAVLGVGATIAGTLAKQGLPIPLVFLLTILAGGLTGLVNGFIVAYIRIPAIVVTLGMSSVLTGGLIIATNGAWIYNLPDGFAFSQGATLGIPNPIPVMFVLVAIFWWWMRYSAAGRQIYAVGGNIEAARLAGIQPRRVILRVFILNGLLVGVASVLYATQFNSIQSNVPANFALTVITAAVIGGVSILGGTGTVIGAMLGTILLLTIGTALNFLYVPSEWLPAVQGLLILITILIDVLRRQRAKR